MATTKRFDKFMNDDPFSILDLVLEMPHACHCGDNNFVVGGRHVLIISFRDGTVFHISLNASYLRSRSCIFVTNKYGSLVNSTLGRTRVRTGSYRFAGYFCTAVDARFSPHRRSPNYAKLVVLMGQQACVSLSG